MLRDRCASSELTVAQRLVPYSPKPLSFTFEEPQGGMISFTNDSVQSEAGAVRTGRISGWAIPGWTTVVVTAGIVLLFVGWGFDEATVRLAARWTARIAVVLFAASFAATGIRHTIPGVLSQWLDRSQRFVFVAFAATHLLHLVTLVLLGVYFPDPFREDLHPITIIGGGLAYVFVVVIAAAASERWRLLLGERVETWIRVVGSYYIWVVFAQAYGLRVLEEPEYLPFLVVLILALLSNLRGLRVSRSA